MRAFLGEQMKARPTPPVTYADFRHWCLKVFQLPGEPDDYDMYAHFSRRYLQLKIRLDASSLFEFHSTIILQRNPDGLAFSIHVLEDRPGCCSIA